MVSPPCYFGVGAYSESIQVPVNEPSSSDFMPSDECVMLSFYATMIKDLCGPKGSEARLRRPERVSATANTMLRRFYLSNSVLDYDPLKIMVASIFLASKAEDLVINSAALSAATKAKNKEVTAEDIASHELLLLSGLSFQLHVTHPHRGALGLVDDLRKFVKAEEWYDEGNLPDFVSLHTKTKPYLDDCVFSDLVLIYSPGKLAIIGVWLALLELQKNRKGAVKKEEYDETAGGFNLNVAYEDWSKVDFKAYMTRRFRAAHDEAKVKVRVQRDRETSIRCGPRSCLLPHVCQPLFFDLLCPSQGLISDVEKGVELGKTLRTDPKLNCVNQENVDMSFVKAIYKKMKKAKTWGKAGFSEKRKAEEEGDGGPNKQIKVE